MAAIVTVRCKTDDAFKAFIEVVQDPAIRADELGVNSGVYQVVFSSAEVRVGTGFHTLQYKVNEYTPGAGAGIERVDWG